MSFAAAVSTFFSLERSRTSRNVQKVDAHMHIYGPADMLVAEAGLTDPTVESSLG